MKLKQNYINHLAFIIDESGSMSGLKNEVIKIFESQVKHLAKRSQETDQETRVSVYLFDDEVKCVIFDKDVLRLPSIADIYRPDASTALIDATLTAIEDLEKTNTLYGDHSFLLIVLSDGQNNVNNGKSSVLSKRIAGLPDNWTIAVMVPDSLSSAEAKKFGFPSGNIQIWDVSKKGMDDVGETFKKATDDYMQMRSTGVKGTKSLFKVDTSKLVSSVVLNELDQVDSSKYKILEVGKYDNDSQIRDFIESNGLTFSRGCAYYELTKTELIQSNKEVAIQNIISKKVYSGDNARNLLGLPNQNVKVTADDFKNYRVFIQSNSVNRKLVSGTKVLFFK